MRAGLLLAPLLLALRWSAGMLLDLCAWEEAVEVLVPHSSLPQPARRQGGKGHNLGQAQAVMMAQILRSEQAELHSAC